MHPNPNFRKTSTQDAHAFAKSRGFGVLALNGQEMPLISHVPFVLNEEHADLHLVRSNPICRAVKEAQAATIVVSGPDGYVSPDWYEVDDQVPTWNYVAVHLIGQLRALPAQELEPMLERQSAFFEGQLEKPPWLMTKMSDATRASFLRMILPFRFEVDRVESTFKLNQNKPDDVRLRAADKIETGVGQELSALAQMMREP